MATIENLKKLSTPRFNWRDQGKRDYFLLALSITQFALFIPIARWAHKHPQPPSELLMTNILQSKRSRSSRSAIRVLSTIAGSAALLNIVVAPTAFFLWKKGLRLEAIMAAGTCWTSALARAVIKLVVRRPRPNPWLVHFSQRKQTTSFPSGHVTSSLTFWGWLLAVGIMQWRKSQPWQKLLLAIPLLCMLLVGPTRVYLGEHWATDVLGGYLLGGGWLSLSLELYLKLRGKRLT